MSPFRASAPQTSHMQYFLFSADDGVATVTLDRPDKLNALTFEAYADLRDLLAELPAAGRHAGPGRARAAAARSAVAATRLPTLGDTINADEAARIGLVSSLVKDDDFEESAGELARTWPPGLRADQGAAGPGAGHEPVGRA